MRLKIKILWQNPGSHKLLLKNSNKIQKTLRLAVTDIIQSIRRHRKSVLPRLSDRSLLHHAHNTFHHIIDIGKIPHTVTVIEYLYLLAADKPVGKTEISHVRTTGRTIDSKETQTSSRNIIQLAV